MHPNSDGPRKQQFSSVNTTFLSTKMRKLLTGAFLHTIVTTEGSFNVSAYNDEKSLLSALADVKVSSIPLSQVGELVTRQYFDAASHIIMKSHDEGIDVSAPIRNAVSDVRNKLDHVVKLLDPEYSLPQRVPPAFQWTQNDTTVFINLKYSRRFNAPGAVDVSDLNCTFTNTSLIFSAIGGHSGKRFEYALNLDFFDLINPEQSKWSEGSVGKVSLSITKIRASRWPRLLATNTKIDNMHYWLEYGEQLEKTMKGLPSVSNSGLSCRARGKVYCPVPDACKDSCETCKGKSDLDEPSSMCVGPPAFSPGEVSFADTDGGKGTIRGTVQVTLKKEHHRFDIDGFYIYLVKNGSELTDSDTIWGQSVTAVSNTTSVDLPSRPLGEDPMEIVAVPFNAFGERRSKPARKQVVDLYLPNNCSRVDPIEFEDASGGDEGSLKGVISLTKPAETDSATNLSFHWGKDSSTRLYRTKAQFADLPITGTSLNLTTGSPIPTGATHVLVYCRSPAGDGSEPVGSWPIAYRKRPVGKVENLRVRDDGKVEFDKIADESDLVGYTVRVNGSSDDLEVVSTSSLWSISKTLAGSRVVPFWSTVCVYVTNSVGIAKEGSCADRPAAEEAKQEL